jgi:hypothetical protein
MALPSETLCTALSMIKPLLLLFYSKGILGLQFREHSGNPKLFVE